MKKVIFLIGFIIIGLNTYSQNAFVQDLDGLAVISFPTKPKVIKTKISSLQFFMTTSNLGIYSVKLNSVEGADNPQRSRLDEYYQNELEYHLNKSKGKLIKKTGFVINGLKGIDFSYHSTENPKRTSLVFERLLLINELLIGVKLVTRTNDQVLSQKERNRFFNSFKITADPKEQVQGYVLKPKSK